MTDATKYRLSIVAAVLVVVAGGAGARMIASQKEPPPKRERRAALRQVALQTLTEGEVAVDIPLQGRLVAVERVPLFAEVTGVFAEAAHPFRLGVAFREGELLARIDDAEARYALLAQKAALANSLAQAMPELKIDYPATFPAWDAYLRDFDAERPLPALPPVTDAPARYFLNARNVYAQYFQIKGAEERLAKYRLRAPVTGTLTEVSATVGALIRAGQPLGTLTASRYELAATVPVGDLDYLRPGTRATLTGPGGRTYEARVARIATQVDPSTQTATVYLSVSGPGLREGLYLSGAATGAELTGVAAVDQRLMVGDDELFVYRDSTLQLQSVEVVRRDADRVFVRGLPPGTRALAEPVPGAYAGMRVNVKE